MRGELTLMTDDEDAIKPFEITYHWTTDSAITLTLDAEKTLEIKLPTVMDEVESLCYALQEKLRQFDKKQLNSETTDADPPPKADASSTDNETDADPPPKADASSTDNEQDSKTSERFFFILKMAIGISDITEKLAGYIP